VAGKGQQIMSEFYIKNMPRGENRPHTIEWAIPNTEAEAIAALKEFDNAVEVIRFDADTGARDVSEDLALIWLDELIRRDGFDPETDEMPSFIRRHVSHSQAMEMVRIDYIAEAAE
jgi:hypothetical protein